MAENTKHARRRWFQFGLGTMFVLVTAFAAWLGWELKFIRDREAFLSWRDRKCEVEQREHPGLDGPVALWVRPKPATIRIWRTWLGDEPAEFVVLPHAASIVDQERAKALFPEALVYAADGTLLAGGEPIPVE
jgi:hypothetical protein